MMAFQDTVWSVITISFRLPVLVTHVPLTARYFIMSRDDLAP